MSVVAAVILAEEGWNGGHADAAAFVIPPFTLAGVAWLTRRWLGGITIRFPGATDGTCIG